MKKIILLAGLLLAAAGSWAFYPKTADAPTGYMSVALSTNLNNKGWLTITSPTGEQQTEELNRSTNGPQLQARALVKLNEMKRQGWTVVQMTSTITSGYGRVDQYLLEKH